MKTLNVKIPDDMETDIDAYLEDHPYYMNRSELVRDAVRRLIEPGRLPDGTVPKVEQSENEFGRGEYVKLEDV